MKIQVIANVINQKKLSGLNERKEWDSSIFGGVSLNTLQFGTDSHGDITCEPLNLSCKPEVFEGNENFVFEKFEPYLFTVDIVEYKSSIKKEVISFERVVIDDKHNTTVTFNTGKKL